MTTSSMIKFDGYAFAQQKETQLKMQVQELAAKGVQPHVAAILFTEDAGSQLYTRLKKEAAERVGIGYSVFSFSMLSPVKTILKQIKELNYDSTITGVIIQKPWRQTWAGVQHNPDKQAFTDWWVTLVSEIAEKKDVDGLHPATLAAVKNGTWQSAGRVLPATARAVLEILAVALPQNQNLASKKIIILGKSEILGQPLFYELKNQGAAVEMLGTAELRAREQSGQKLLDADVIISSTGQPNLITGEMIKDGAVVIDVGEPRPDVDAASVASRASFLTPVPGGVGPVTIVSLLANCLTLSNAK